jgi:hypothetical protein
MHIVKAFTQLHVRKILNVSILKWYTRDARSLVEWNWNDVVNGGRDRNKEEMQFAKLVPVAMGIARVGTKSDYASEEAYERATTLRALIETIPTNMTRAAPQCDEGT